MAYGKCTYGFVIAISLGEVATSGDVTLRSSIVSLQQQLRSNEMNLKTLKPDLLGRLFAANGRVGKV